MNDPLKFPTTISPWGFIYAFSSLSGGGFCPSGKLLGAQESIWGCVPVRISSKSPRISLPSEIPSLSFSLFPFKTLYSFRIDFPRENVDYDVKESSQWLCGKKCAPKNQNKTRRKNAIRPRTGWHQQFILISYPPTNTHSQIPTGSHFFKGQVRDTQP